MSRHKYIAILFWSVLAILYYLYRQHDVSIVWAILWSVAYVIVIVIGVTHIRWNYFVNSYNSGDTTVKEIAITFDDGPNTETHRILDTLAKHRVHAAFFCIGKNVEANPLLVTRMYEEGHTIGNHTYTHSNTFDLKSTPRMYEDIQECNRIIKQILGVQPRLFRPPFGVTNPNVNRAIKRAGMLSVGWSLRSLDTKAKSKEQLKRRIFNRLKAGDIILLHDSVVITAEILTDIIQEAQQKGFTFVPVEKLLDINAYA